MVVDLPYNFVPRDYQLNPINAFFKEKYKRIILVYHRRAGKDLTILNIAVMACFQRVGSYYYMFPEISQARKAIWEGQDDSGRRFIDYFPKSIIKKINHTRMTVEFINGSVFRICGSDRYNSLMGTNPVGVVFSEYSLQNPAAWDFFRPILIQNKGWASFIYTPRGKNHGYDLLQMAKNNPKWYVDVKSIKDTKRHDGSPVISEEMIQEERESGMPEALIQQEYYCSFDAANVGCIYEKEYQLALDEGRIRNIEINPRAPVFTAWDIGYTDATSVWFMQQGDGNSLNLIYYLEDNFQGPHYYLEKLKEISRQLNIVYAQDFLPHDCYATNFQAGGKTTADTFRMYSRQTVRVPKLSLAEGIASVRYLFPRLNFNEKYCQQGIECLRSYRKIWKDKEKSWSKNPEDGWASHGADALRMLCVAWNDRFTQDKSQRVAKIKSWEMRI